MTSGTTVTIKRYGLRLHCLVVLLQSIAAIVAFVTGVILLVLGNFTSSSLSLLETIDKDEKLHYAGSKQDERTSEEKLNCLWLVLTITGAVALAVSVLIMVHMLQIISLMMGPDSSRAHKRVSVLKGIRRHMARELKEIQDKRIHKHRHK